MQVLKIVFIVLEVLLLFNLLIFVHELGHFLAAKWRGLKIERFAIWFGKPIWKATRGGIEYALGWIPAGGYVSLPQMAAMDAIEGKTTSDRDTLAPVSALDKIIVAFAGPLFSFLLAIAFAVVVWWVGRPVTEAESTTVIGYVDKNGPAGKAGLCAGDRILEVDGRPVTKFGGMGSSITWRVVRSEGATIPIKFERKNSDGTVQIMEVNVTPTKDETKAWQRKSLRKILIEPYHTPIVGDVSSNSPAARAGLQRGDEIVAVNGTKLYSNGSLGDFIEAHPGAPLTLKVIRAGRPLEFSVTPQIPLHAAAGEDVRPMIGVAWDLSGGRMTIVHPTVTEQIVGSVDALVSTVGALLSRKSDIKPQHLSGAVKIINIYYILFQSDHGWRQALWFSVILNINLALLNLLPIPVLDGGHIVLSIVEGIRRKPANARLIGYIQTACAMLLIGYMLYVTFFDLQDSTWRLKDKPAQEMQFAPKADSPAAPPAQVPAK